MLLFIIKQMETPNKIPMKKLINKIAILSLVLLFVYSNLQAQEEVVNDFQNRMWVGLSYKPAKKLKFSLTPEIRYDENFSINRFLIEGEAKYKIVKFLSIDGTYRFVVNQRETKVTQYLNRFGLSATVKKDFKRFEPSLRILYSNYTDDEITNNKFLRYKASLEYDIAKSKLFPFVAVEAFQQLGDNKILYKMRYTAGMEYKLNKKNFIGLSYKLDYFKHEYTNKHIVSLGYKFKF